jgi:DNA-binding response OmpR family regulator
MPEIDGAELATQIGRDWALHDVPIVFVTALITPEEVSDGRRIDGHRISAKPHTAAELLRVVEEKITRVNHDDSNASDAPRRKVNCLYLGNCSTSFG